MKKKLRYTSIVSIGTAVHTILLFGVYSLYSVMSKVADIIVSKDYSKYSELGNISPESIIGDAKMFVFGFIATVVLSICLFIYYTYEEKQRVILAGAIVSLVSAILVFSTLTSVVSMINSADSIMSSLLSGDVSVVSKLSGGLGLALFGALIATLYHVIILLQGLNVIHIESLARYMPTMERKKVVQTKTVTPSISSVKGTSVKPRATGDIYDMFDQEDDGGVK